MAYAHFEAIEPSGGALFSSGTIRNNENAIHQGDIYPLRARAQDTPDLTVQVGGGLVENYYQQVWFNNEGTPLNYAGGNTPAITTPSVNPRIALLTIDREGTLTWTYGDEAETPVAPSCPEYELPIAYVYERVGMTQVVNYEDRTSYPSGGYLYRDIRPLVTPASRVEDIRSTLARYDSNSDDLISEADLLEIIEDWNMFRVSNYVLNVAIYIWGTQDLISGLPGNLPALSGNIFTGILSYNAYFKGGYGTKIGGAIYYRVQTITESLLLSTSPYDSHVILADATAGEITITLPKTGFLPIYSGMEYVIKKIDNSNNVVISGNTKTIDGAATKTLTTQYETVRIITDSNKNWHII